MKKSLSFFCGISLVMLFLALMSCGEQRSVKRTARTFLQSYYISSDFEAAKAVSTRLTHENIDTRAMMFHLNPNLANERFRSFRIDRIDVRKTRAVVFYTVDDVERRLNLSRIDGNWLVDMPENASLNPNLSLAPTRGGGGFASATSEPIRLRDVPSVCPNDSSK